MTAPVELAVDAEAARLAAVRALQLLDTPAEERFDRIARTARRLLGTSGALLTLLDRHRVWVKAGDGSPGTVPGTEVRRDESFCTHTVDRGVLCVVEDARRDPVFAHNPAVTGDPGVVFYAGVPLRAPDGQYVGTLCVVDDRPRRLADDDRQALLDLAAWAELELRTDELGRAATELERMRRWAAKVLASAAEAIIALDADGRMILANPAATAITGWMPAELIGRPLLETLMCRADDGTPVDAEAHPVTAALRDGSVGTALDGVVWRRDERPLPVIWSVSPIEENGAIVGAVLVAEDATRRREVDRLKDEFISVVSHELRTPLTAIRGSLGLLTAGVLGQLPPAAAEMAEVATRNTERLVRLVNDILDLERLRAGRMLLSCQDADLLGLAQQSVRNVVTSAEGGPNTPRVVVRGEPVTACVDADRIVQALTNLIANAVKFTGPAGTVTVSVTALDDGALLQVADTGRGIPAEKLERIFEPFEQAETGDLRKGGTGLGLAITQHIAEAHGGQINVASEAGVGSTFAVLLPLRSSGPARPSGEGMGG